MNKQINYQVNFNANTTQVQTALQQLQASLKNISAKPIAIDDGSLKNAVSSANELNKALTNAVNVNTGKLDISKFSQQLKKSGHDLNYHATQLKSLGADGQMAFLQLAKSIAMAEVPLRKHNALLSSMLVTLKNTAKWQISSSILTSFTSALSTAVNYAKDLDESLNNIRIVSGQSAAQMDAFAEKANKAAKALSSTTTAYTDAALIYYQQGLSSKEVEERTAATIKMANVTGEAADQVSSYMTAIWNNFDDGSKSLEYYADVITKLGAITASSSDEIATGLEKFAGIAETVGLSYEYATSALATLVAETRQSPETVGTALKTIFSRLQGLSLGETLEDGTTLNKYSEALKTVGVDIKDANGNLKNMDDILTDLAKRWDYLSKDSQMALAQTVGGVRQYTQLITLMDNWEDMEKNISAAAEATGTLNAQQAIFQESWKAASKELKASLEGLYSNLVPKEELKDLTLIFSSITDSVSGVVEGMGGIGNILLPVFGMLAATYMPQLVSGAVGFSQNLMQAFGFGEKTKMSLLQQANSLLSSKEIMSSTVPLYDQMLAKAQEIIQLEIYKNQNVKSLTSARQQELEVLKQQKIAELDLLNAQSQRLQGQNLSAKAKTKEVTNRVTQERVDTINAEKEQEMKERTHSFAREIRGAKARLGVLNQAQPGDNNGYQSQAEIERAKAEQKRIIKTQTRAMNAEKGAVEEEYKGKIRTARLAENDKRIQQSREDSINSLRAAAQREQLYKNSGLGGIRTARNMGNEEAYGVDISKIKSKEQAQAVLNQLTTARKETMTQLTTGQKSVGSELATKKEQLNASYNNLKQQGLLNKNGNLKSDYSKASPEQQQQIEVYKRLRTEIQSLEKAQTSYTKRLKQLNKANKDFNKAQEEVNKTLEKFKDKTNLSEDEVKQLIEALTKLDEAGDFLANLGEGAVEGATDAATKRAENLDIDNTDEIKDEGVDNANEELKQKLLEQDRLNAQITEAQQQRWDGVGMAVQGVTSAFSGMSMALQAFQSLGNIWNNDDLSTGEKIVSTMMTLSMLLPSLSSAYAGIKTAIEGVNLVKKSNIALSQLKQANDVKEAVIDTATTNTNIANENREQASTKGGILVDYIAGWTKAAAKAAGGDFSGILTMSAITGLVAVVGVSAFNLAAGQAQAKKKAEETNEAYTEGKQKYETNTTNKQEFDSLISDYKKTGIQTEELKNKTKELADSYGILGASLANASGNYDDFIDTLDEAYNKEQQIQLQKTEGNLRAQGALIFQGAGIDKGEGGNGLGGDIYTQTTQSSLSEYQDELDYFRQKYGEILTIDDDGTVKINYNVNDQRLNGIHAAFQEEYYNKMTALGVTREEDKTLEAAYQKVNSLGDISSNALVSYNDEQLIKSQQIGQQVLKDNEINSLEDYNSALQEYLTYTTATNIPVEEATKTFNGLSEATRKYGEQAAAIKDLEDKGIDSSIIDNLIQKYGEDAVINADLEPWMDQEQLENEVQKSQEWLNNNKLTVNIQTKLTAANEIEKAIQEGTLSTWLKTNGYTEQEGIALLGMSPQERQNYILNKNREKTAGKFGYSGSKSTDDLQKELEASKANLEDARKEVETTKTSYEDNKDSFEKNHGESKYETEVVQKSKENKYNGKTLGQLQRESLQARLVFTSSEPEVVAPETVTEIEGNDTFNEGLRQLRDKGATRYQLQQYYVDYFTDVMYGAQVLNARQKYSEYKQAEQDKEEIEGITRDLYNQLEASEEKDNKEGQLPLTEIDAIRQSYNTAQNLQSLIVAGFGQEKGLTGFFDKALEFAGEDEQLYQTILDYEREYYDIMNDTSLALEERAKKVVELDQKYENLINHAETYSNIETAIGQENFDILNANARGGFIDEAQVEAAAKQAQRVLRENFDVNLPIDEIIANWEELNSILNYSNLSYAEINRQLLAIETNDFTNSNKLKKKFKDIFLILGIVADEHTCNGAITKFQEIIKKFDIKEGTWDQLRNLLAECGDAATAAAVAMLLFGDSIPDNMAGLMGDIATATEKVDKAGNKSYILSSPTEDTLEILEGKGYITKNEETGEYQDADEKDTVVYDNKNGTVTLDSGTFSSLGSTITEAILAAQTGNDGNQDKFDSKEDILGYDADAEFSEDEEKKMLNPLQLTAENLAQLKEEYPELTSELNKYYKALKSGKITQKEWNDLINGIKFEDIVEGYKKTDLAMEDYLGKLKEAKQYNLTGEIDDIEGQIADELNSFFDIEDIYNTLLDEEFVEKNLPIIEKFFDNPNLQNTQALENVIRDYVITVTIQTSGLDNLDQIETEVANIQKEIDNIDWDAGEDAVQAKLGNILNGAYTSLNALGLTGAQVAAIITSVLSTIPSDVDTTWVFTTIQNIITNIQQNVHTNYSQSGQSFAGDILTEEEYNALPEKSRANYRGNGQIGKDAYTKIGNNYYVKGSGDAEQAAIFQQIYDNLPGADITTNVPAYEQGEKENDALNKGGGGGGGQSDDPEKKVKKYNAELEKTKAILENIGKEYEKLEKLSDSYLATDEDRLVNLIGLNNNLNEQLDLYHDMKTQADDALPKAQTEMLKWVKEAKFSEADLQYDQEGRIINLPELIQKMDHKIADAGSGDEQSELEEAKGLMEEGIENYNEIVEASVDAEMGILDTSIEISKNNLEQITLPFEIFSRRTEQERKNVETYLGWLEDVNGKSIDRLNYRSKTSLSLLEEYGANEDKINTLLATGLTTQAQRDALEEALNHKLELRISLLEEQKAIIEEVGSYLEEHNEYIDRFYDTFDRINSLLDTYKSVMEVIGKNVEEHQAINLKISDTQIKNSQMQLRAAKATKEAAQATYDAVKKAYDDAVASGDATLISHWEEQLWSAEDRLNEAADNFQSAWTDSLDLILERYELAVEQTILRFEDSLSPQKTLDEKSKLYENLLEESDRFLTNEERVYELNKINRQINQEMSKNPNILVQQKLLGIQELINKLKKDEANITDYQLSKLQKIYDLRLAEIALEEAQNNKTQARLVRNSQGNWNYVFTADQGQIDQAAQQLEDARYNYYNNAKEQADNLSKEILDNEKNLSEALKNIKREDYTSEEEYRKALDDTAKYYLNRDAYLRAQMDEALYDSGQSYADSVLGQIEGYESLDAAHQNLETATETAINEMVSHFATFEEEVKNTMTEAGEDYDTFVDKLDTSLDSITSWSETASTNVSNACKTMVDSFQTVIDKAIEFAKAVNLDGMTTEEFNETIKTDSNSAFDKTYNTPSGHANTDYTGLALKLYETYGEDAIELIEIVNQMRNQKISSGLYDTKDATYMSAEEFLNYVKSNSTAGSNALGKNIELDLSKEIDNDIQNALNNLIDNSGYFDATKHSQGVSSSASEKENANFVDRSNIVNVTTGEKVTEQQLYDALSSPGLRASFKLNDLQVNFTTGPDGNIYGTSEHFVGIKTLDEIRAMAQFKDAFNPDFADDLASSWSSISIEDPQSKYLEKDLIMLLQENKDKFLTLSKQGYVVRVFFKSEDNTVQATDEQGNPLWWSDVRENLGYSGEGYLEWLKELGINRFDTGGYTGDWNSKDGKLAVLHEKEIVLNKADTKNLLSAVEVLRGMSSSIAGMLLGNAGHQMNSLARAISVAAVGTQDRTLQQQVHIDATFPGVTSAFEIETALNNIINDVSQYAEIKKF